ncbi:hypothetical protein K1X12_06995 [Hyphomonas sp. WL0036]|uniref:hypothetical protein n=1 Tax=Hyphomonas sediminis TaxID=2866160 RepID=UPI001C7EF5D6|nr:hypothetical protein [Hyphomonas sediminis]MBY9066639.1 hypothetical protein [Hyphomonas sediminis]
MRSVFVCVSLGLLAGCATVSVVPGETTVEAALTKSQSELRKSSDAYCDRLAEKGWAEADKGLAGFADLLIRGRSALNEAPAYASDIGAATRAPVLVLAKISADSEAARMGLDGVTDEAREVLKNAKGGASNRNDVIAYERALVRAQMAHRNFRDALEMVSTRADMDVSPVRADLMKFSDSIDEARRVADRLAERYTGDYDAAS